MSLDWRAPRGPLAGRGHGRIRQGEQSVHSLGAVEGDETVWECDMCQFQMSCLKIIPYDKACCRIPVSEFNQSCERRA